MNIQHIFFKLMYTVLLLLFGFIHIIFDWRTEMTKCKSGKDVCHKHEFAVI